jgi:hypothetical protein
MFRDSVPAEDPVPGNRDPSAGKGPAQAAMVHRKKRNGQTFGGNVDRFSWKQKTYKCLP